MSETTVRDHRPMERAGTHQGLVDATVVCHSCREKVGPRDNFCRHCGHRFTGTIRQTPLGKP